MGDKGTWLKPLPLPTLSNIPVRKAHCLCCPIFLSGTGSVKNLFLPTLTNIPARKAHCLCYPAEYIFILIPVYLDLFFYLFILRPEQSENDQA